MSNPLSFNNLCLIFTSFAGKMRHCIHKLYKKEKKKNFLTIYVK